LLALRMVFLSFGIFARSFLCRYEALSASIVSPRPVRVHDAQDSAMNTIAKCAKSTHSASDQSDNRSLDGE
jgi:hypothetical protein